MKPKVPFIPGHEAVGLVTAIGAGVSIVKEGNRVGVPWLCSACGHRECLRLPPCFLVGNALKKKPFMENAIDVPCAYIVANALSCGLPQVWQRNGLAALCADRYIGSLSFPEHCLSFFRI